MEPCLLPVPTCNIGLQLRAELLMYTMPILDTVAGEAFSMLCTSNSSLQLGAMGMRSPLARVSVLLSSNTEFKFSIQMASTGPSKMRKMFSPANKARGCRGRQVGFPSADNKHSVLVSQRKKQTQRETPCVPFLAFNVFLHRVEKIPSVQSLVAVSSLPNI